VNVMTGDHVIDSV